ncbi:MAG: ATP-binding protein, partial [Bacillales bacterium]
MSLLPKNERKTAKETPRNFVIYGGTMHGKTYFADEFPNPLNLNTDGNAEMIETPSINIGHQRDSKGKITKSASDLLSDIIVELESTNHTFETVVIDVIDDIITLFEQEITEEHNVRSVGDISWGKGHQMLEMMVRVFVMRLKELSMKKKMNIIYVSRLNIIEENDVEVHVPSL